MEGISLAKAAPLRPVEGVITLIGLGLATFVHWSNRLLTGTDRSNYCNVRGYQEIQTSIGKEEECILEQ